MSLLSRMRHGQRNKSKRAALYDDFLRAAVIPLEFAANSTSMFRASPAGPMESQEVDVPSYAGASHAVGPGGDMQKENTTTTNGRERESPFDVDTYGSPQPSPSASLHEFFGSESGNGAATPYAPRDTAGSPRDPAQKLKMPISEGDTHAEGLGAVIGTQAGQSKKSVRDIFETFTQESDKTRSEANAHSITQDRVPSCSLVASGSSSSPRLSDSDITQGGIEVSGSLHPQYRAAVSPDVILSFGSERMSEVRTPSDDADAFSFEPALAAPCTFALASPPPLSSKHAQKTLIAAQRMAVPSLDLGHKPIAHNATSQPPRPYRVSNASKLSTDQGLRAPLSGKSTNLDDSRAGTAAKGYGKETITAEGKPRFSTTGVPPTQISRAAERGNTSSTSSADSHLGSRSGSSFGSGSGSGSTSTLSATLTPTGAPTSVPTASYLHRRSMSASKTQRKRCWVPGPDAFKEAQRADHSPEQEEGNDQNKEEQEDLQSEADADVDRKGSQGEKDPWESPSTFRRWMEARAKERAYMLAS